MSNRERGARGERELCHLLADSLGFSVTRNLGQARDSGHDVDVPGFSIEVKRRRRIGLLYEALEQALGGEGIPAVASRADGKEWLVTMRLGDWIKVCREEIIAHLSKQEMK